MRSSKSRSNPFADRLTRPYHRPESAEIAQICHPAIGALQRGSPPHQYPARCTITHKPKSRLTAVPLVTNTNSIHLRTIGFEPQNLVHQDLPHAPTPLPAAPGHPPISRPVHNHAQRQPAPFGRTSPQTQTKKPLIKNWLRIAKTRHCAPACHSPKFWNP